MIYIDGAGEFKGLQIELDHEMVENISFNTDLNHTVIQLKKGVSCQIHANKKIAGCMPHGSQIPVAESVARIRKRLKM